MLGLIIDYPCSSIHLMSRFLYFKRLYWYPYSYESKTYKLVYPNDVSFINGNTKIKNKQIILTLCYHGIEVRCRSYYGDLLPIEVGPEDVRHPR